MNKNGNGKDPIAQEPQLIFKAELVERDGKKVISFTRNSTHIPTLDYIVGELQFNIIGLRAEEKFKQNQANKPILQGPQMSLREFLARKRR